MLKALNPETITASFEMISNKGHDFEKDLISSIKSNYNSGKKLSADELISLNDVYIAVTQRLENSRDDNNE